MTALTLELEAEDNVVLTENAIIMSSLTAKKIYAQLADALGYIYVLTNDIMEERRNTPELKIN